MQKTNFTTIGRLFAVCLLLFLSAACQQEKEDAASPPTSSAPKAPRAIPVDGFVIQASSLQEIINATGNLIAYEAVEIRPERSGKLIDLDFEEASFVKAGTVLGKIDTEELVAQRNRLDVALDLAIKEVARGKELLAVQGISMEELDRLENRVEDIKAEQQVIDVQLDKSEIRAPFSGVLGLRTVSRGAYVTPNDVIVDLKQINPIKLEFEVPERFLVKVKPGQELNFTTAGSGQVFKARVYATATEISPETRTFKVRATAQNGGNLLKPGQFAKVTLVTGVNNKAMLAPTDAVIPVLDGKQIYVARKGRAIATFVQTGERQADEVEIIHGLQLGDTVIVSGLLSLSDGALIEVTNLVKSQKQALK